MGDQGGDLKRQGRERGFWPTALKAEFFARALAGAHVCALQLAGFSCKHFLWFFGRGISSFFEEIRAGRGVGRIQLSWCSKHWIWENNQTVKSSFAEERSNIFFLVHSRELSAAVLYFACSSNWSKPEWLKYMGLRTSQWRSSVPWKARACEG